MRAFSSHRFGAVSVDPLATKPIPMDYQELLDEIEATRRQLDASTDVGDRVARRLRLVRLTEARDAWDAHVREQQLTLPDLATGDDVVADRVVEV
jgi:hypothetical protein